VIANFFRTEINHPVSIFYVVGKEVYRICVAENPENYDETYVLIGDIENDGRFIGRLLYHALLSNVTGKLTASSTDSRAWPTSKTRQYTVVRI